MNKEVLMQMKEMVEATAQRLARQFDVFSINTSSPPNNDNPSKTCESVATKVLEWVEHHLEEHILHLPSVSGRFVSLDELVADADQDTRMEAWTAAILRHFLISDPKRFAARLFE